MFDVYALFCLSVEFVCCFLCITLKCVYSGVCVRVVSGVSLKGGCTMNCVLSCVCVRCVNGEV